MIEALIYWSGVAVILAGFWVVIPFLIHIGNTAFDRTFVRTRNNAQFILGIFYARWYVGKLDDEATITDPDGNRWTLEKIPEDRE